MLIALVLRANETVSADSLVDLLWGDALPRDPANALQIQVSYARKMLSSGEPSGGELIETRPGGYALVVRPEQIDANQFGDLVREAEARAAGGASRDLQDALDCLDRALALWRGDPLADVAGEAFAMGETARLGEARWAAIEARTDVLLELGRHRELIGELSQLVDRSPLRERFHEQLMLALYRCGRQADAIRAYDVARDLLLDELGLDPGPGLQQLLHGVLEQRPDLDWVSPSGEDLPLRRASPAPATVLTVPVTGLVGRAGEVERIQHVLDLNRVVTLTGPGGAGKSRLALEVAHDKAAAGEHVWFIDLGVVADPDRVAANVATALGVPTSPDENSCAAVAQALTRERGLVVLDTCEHVLTGAAAVAVEILRVCPGVRILATSRRPLGIIGEVAWPVPPLALPPPGEHDASEVASFPAVELFVARAHAVRPDFEVTDESAADIAAICLTLDGLPLAIELAAARADVLAPAAIKTRLERRFDLLIDGGREATARQQTLRSALDWSFDLLEEDQRRFFARLGVFVGSFDFDAAAAVAGAGLGDPLSLLSALVRSSMVMVQGQDRYRLLDTLHAYAADLLDEADDGTRAAHARYYTALAEEAEAEIVAADQVRWLARVREDVPNFRTAVEWSFANDSRELAARLSGALSWFWILEGTLAEAVAYLERAATVTTLPPIVRTKVLSGVALMNASLGRLDTARAAAVDSVALGPQTGSPSAHAFALNALAVVNWALDDLDGSAAAHDEAIAILDGTDNPWEHGVCLALRARTAIETGDPNGPQMAEAALGAARVSGDRHVIGLALLQIAQLRLDTGDLDAATDAATECLRMQEEIAYTEGTVAALHLLARCNEGSGDRTHARELNLRALALADRIGHVAAVCEALEALAALAAAEGNIRDVLRLIEAADLERSLHDLPARASDRASLLELRGGTDAHDGIAEGGHMTTHSTADVIASLLHAQ